MMSEENDKSSYFDFTDMRLIPSSINSKYEIKNISDFYRLDRIIRLRVRHYELSALLQGIKDIYKEKKELLFVAGVITKYALIESNVLFGWTPIFRGEIECMLEMVYEYSLYDPKFNKEPDETDESIKKLILRKMGSQLIYSQPLHNIIGTTFYLFYQIPKSINGKKNFLKDIVEEKFEKDFGFSLHDFFQIGFLLYMGSIKPNFLTREYLNDARKYDSSVPSDEKIIQIMRHFVCNKYQYKELEKSETSYLDPYKYNTLFDYPIIRVWSIGEELSPEKDLLIAPIPKLIVFRFSTGLYFQLQDSYPRFTEAFGYVFENYVGKLINWYNLIGTIFSEEEINSRFPNYHKKRPDWIIFTKKGIILIECKAIIYSRRMYETGELTRGSISTLKDAARKMKDIIDLLPEIVEQNKIETEISVIHKIIVTYGMNIGLKKGHPLRKKIEKELITEGYDADWSVISIGEMEEIQPYIEAGFDIFSFFDNYEKIPFNEIISNMQKKTNKQYRDSKIFDNQNAMFREILNLPEDFKY